MKKYFLFVILSITVSLEGQLIYDDWGDIVPYSQIEKYKNLISQSEISGLTLPDYNNDSLFEVKNRNYATGSRVIAGFIIDTLVDIRSSGTRIEIDEGVLLLYTIYSKTAEGLTAIINNFEVPEGGYIVFLPASEEGKPYHEEPYVIDHEESKDYGDRFHESIFGNKLLIEYFEPKHCTSNAEILLTNIGYSYYNSFKKKSTSKDGGHVVPGQSGTVPCQKDVRCSEGISWEEQSNSVAYMKFEYFDYGSSTRYLFSGTGFFINRVGNYVDSEYPYLVSCGHFLFRQLYDGSIIDFSQQLNNISILTYVNYKNPTCNDSKIVYGSSIRKIELIDLGSGYNQTTPQTPPISSKYN